MPVFFAPSKSFIMLLGIICMVILVTPVAGQKKHAKENVFLIEDKKEYSFITRRTFEAPKDAYSPLSSQLITGNSASVETYNIQRLNVDVKLQSLRLDIANSNEIGITGRIDQLAVRNIGSGTAPSNIAFRLVKLGDCYLNGEYDKVNIQGNISKLSFLGGYVNKELVLNESIIGMLDLNGSQLPKEIFINNVNFKAGVPINFQQRDFDAPIKVHLSNVTNADFIFNPQSTVFLIESKDYDNRISLLKAILKRIDKSLYPDQYGLYDKQYQEAYLMKDGHWFLNWVQKKWWGYGYDRSNIIKGSAYAFLFVFFLNLFVFQFLRRIYAPGQVLVYLGEIKARYWRNSLGDRANYQFARALLVMLYSAYIFWGIKLDFEKITIKYWPVLIILVSEYLVGLITLGYIANYILAK